MEIKVDADLQGKGEGKKRFSAQENSKDLRLRDRINYGRRDSSSPPKNYGGSSE